MSTLALSIHLLAVTIGIDYPTTALLLFTFSLLPLPLTLLMVLLFTFCLAFTPLRVLLYLADTTGYLATSYLALAYLTPYCDAIGWFVCFSGFALLLFSLSSLLITWLVLPLILDL